MKAVQKISQLRLMPLILTVVTVVVLTALLGGFGRDVPRSKDEITLSFAPVVKKTAPAVVNVYALKREVSRHSRFSGRAFADPFFDDFFGIPRERVSRSLGSGVIVDSSGLIVTNHHVVDGATQMRVILSDRTEFDAELLLSDDRTDLAVLKIDPGSKKLSTITISNKRNREVGDLVLAIGNPYGVGQSVTSGIISAVSRTDVGITDFSFFIQTDAAVNPGNSGGALVDMRGELIGVNTAIFSRSGGSNGIGFAIPVEMVKRVVAGAQKGGNIERSWLGAKTQAVTKDMAQSVGLDRPIGAIIVDLWEDGPAMDAGLKEDDIILSIDGQTVYDSKAVEFLVATFEPGRKYDAVIFRNGKEVTRTIKAESPPGAGRGQSYKISSSRVFAGLSVEKVTPYTSDQFDLDPFTKGVVVSDVSRGSAASRLGFAAGDLLLQINGTKINSIADVKKAVTKDGRYWEIVINRNGRVIRSRFRG